jgi:hypothetical protein
MADQATQTAAASAIAELRGLLASGTMEIEVQPLMQLADQAVSAFDLEKDRKEIADMLLEALTVVRFAPVFGHDPNPGKARANAILDAIAKATLAPT